MTKGTTKSPAVGSRVEIPAYTDLWMRGARFGVVARVYTPKGSYLQANDPRGAIQFGVRMDHPQVKKLAWVVGDDCTYTS